MPRPPNAAGDAEQRAREIIATTDDVDMLRTAQAVLMPLQGMTLEQTAEVLGRDKFWVSRARNRFIRGEAPQGQHGGRRNAYFNQQQEDELVRDALADRERQTGAEYWETTLREVLRRKLSEVTKLSISDSMITDLLDRYTSRFIPGAKWGELGSYQYILTRMAWLEVEVPQWRKRRAKN